MNTLFYFSSSSSLCYLVKIRESAYVYIYIYVCNEIDRSQRSVNGSCRDNAARVGLKRVERIGHEFPVQLKYSLSIIIIYNISEVDITIWRNDNIFHIEKLLRESLIFS